MTIFVSMDGDKFVAELNGMSASGESQMEAIQNVFQKCLDNNECKTESIEQIENHLPF